MEIRQDDLSGEATRELVRLHREKMFETSPPEYVFALDLTGLTAPDVTVWTAWEGDAIMGMGALRQHDDRLGEVKSMRTHPSYLGRGVGAAMLDCIIAEAHARGLVRLSLETGKTAAFEAALALYRKRGFVDGPAFADYAPNDFSIFLHLRLE